MCVCVCVCRLVRNFYGKENMRNQHESSSKWRSNGKTKANFPYKFVCRNVERVELEHLLSLEIKCCDRIFETKLRRAFFSE